MKNFIGSLAFITNKKKWKSKRYVTRASDRLSCPYPLGRWSMRIPGGVNWNKLSPTLWHKSLTNLYILIWTSPAHTFRPYSRKRDHEETGWGQLLRLIEKGKGHYESVNPSLSLSLSFSMYIFIHNYMYTAHTPHVRMYIKCTQTIINVHCIKVEVRVIPISMYLIVCKTISTSLITTVIHVLICITVNTWRGVVHVWVGGGVLLI